jgi:putative addiction module killer protein
MAKATTPITVTYFNLKAFRDWIDDIGDRRVVDTILRRLRQLENGNEGDMKSLGDGVSEMRIHLSPGYRIYFARAGDVVIIILHSGTKRRQMADIKQAKQIWLEIRDEV